MGDCSLIKPGDLLLTEPAEPSKEDKTVFEEMSLEEIEKTLKRHRGNKTQTAKALGIAYSTLFEKLKKHKIQ